MRRIWAWVMVVAALLLAAGCAQSQQELPQVERLAQEKAALEAQVKALEEQVEELEAEAGQLRSRLRRAEEAAAVEVDLSELINPRYPPAVGGTEGWRYHQITSADLDGDGMEETVSVTTSAVWMEERKEYGWDDGHPWHVYVEEPDGTRTYVFSNWVQLGKLEVLVTTGDPYLVILVNGGSGLSAYRIAYEGPQQVRVERLMSLGVLTRAYFTPESFPR